MTRWWWVEQHSLDDRDTPILLYPPFPPLPFPNYILKSSCVLLLVKVGQPGPLFGSFTIKDHTAAGDDRRVWWRTLYPSTSVGHTQVYAQPTLWRVLLLPRVLMHTREDPLPSLHWLVSSGFPVQVLKTEGRPWDPQILPSNSGRTEDWSQCSHRRI